MAKRNEIYKCSVCGNIVEVLVGGKGRLVCCGKEMEILHEKTSEQGLEKHVPVVEKSDEGIVVKVGSVPHPMEDNHYIEWIEVFTDGRVYRKYLHPGILPEASFSVQIGDVKLVREHCNVHGLWKNKP